MANEFVLLLFNHRRVDFVVALYCKQLAVGIPVPIAIGNAADYTTDGDFPRQHRDRIAVFLIGSISRDTLPLRIGFADSGKIPPANHDKIPGARSDEFPPSA